ncbi:MAG: GNAT family N-acetyltransferase [Cyanobacteria bacterium P01_F01_bin.153]
MEYIETPSQELPLKLLLIADPSRQKIQTYLPNSVCYAAKAGNIVAACVANVIGDSTFEIFNLSVDLGFQNQGIGTKLLNYSLSQMKKNGVKRVELGTGTFGYQLTFYHRIGFRADAVIKDHFLNNYQQPIVECGIQHQDMLRLYLNL